MAYVIKCISHSCYRSRHGYDTNQKAAIRFSSYVDAAKALAVVDPPPQDGEFRIVRLKPKPAKGEEYESVGWVYDNGKSPVVVWTDGALANMGRDSWLTSSFRNGRCDGGRVVVYRKVPRV